MVETCQIPAASNTDGLNYPNTTYFGVYLESSHPIVGETIESISFWVKALSSPTGDISMAYFTAWSDSSPSPTSTSNNSFDAATFSSGSFTKYTWTFTTPITVAAGSGFQLTGITNGEVTIDGDTNSQDYSYQYQQYYKASIPEWRNYGPTTSNLRFCWSTGSTPPSTSSTFYPPPPAYIHL